MKFVIDMNLSPAWINVLQDAGWAAVHWSTVGYPNARDVEIMDWAREHGYIVITLDLDFAEILATTNARGPSVIQLRARHGLEALSLASFDGLPSFRTIVK